MKKRIIALLLTTVLTIICMPITVSAEGSTTVSTTTVYYADGSYGVITVTEVETIDKATKSGSKQYDHYDATNNKVWTYTITGVYSYNGSTSSCTSVSDSYNIINSNWHVDSHSCWKSGNTAYGTITVKHKVLGVTINTVTQSLSLSCSANESILEFV